VRMKRGGDGYFIERMPCALIGGEADAADRWRG